MRIFQLQGFEMAQGRLVARLRVCYDEPLVTSTRRSAFWMQAEDSPVDIAAALALPANHRVLLTLAGVPDDSTVEWAIREVGSSGSMDLVALVRRSGGGPLLVHLDCSGSAASPARLREQVAQAVRTTLSTLAKVTFTDRTPRTKLVVLSGWRRGVPVPTDAKPLPALQREPEILEPVPEPQVWGYVTLAREAKPEEIYVAFGLWSEFNERPWTLLSAETIAVPWQRWAPMALDGLGKGAELELEQHKGRVRVSLRIKSSVHKASMKQDRHGNRITQRVRALRAACYAGHMEVGAGRFVGETIEGGIPRLHWDWAQDQAPSAEAARQALCDALVRYAEPVAAPTTEPTG